MVEISRTWLKKVMSLITMRIFSNFSSLPLHMAFFCYSNTVQVTHCNTTYRDATHGGHMSVSHTTAPFKSRRRKWRLIGDALLGYEDDTKQVNTHNRIWCIANYAYTPASWTCAYMIYAYSNRERWGWLLHNKSSKANASLWVITYESWHPFKCAGSNRIYGMQTAVFAVCTWEIRPIILSFG